MLARVNALLRSTASIPRHLGLALFLGLVLVYQANASVVDEGDAVPSVELPYVLLETGKPSFDPQRFPEMFKWHAEPPLQIIDGSWVPSWDSRFDDKTLGQWQKDGFLALHGPRYFLVASPVRQAYVVLLGVLIYLCVHHPRSLLPFAIGALPGSLAIAGYNSYYFGSPLVFAQGLVGHSSALEKTGSPELWQTPLWQGFLGLLVSPSRGLLVFSPVLVLAFWGIVRIWRNARFRAFRPLTIAALVMMAIQCKWFDWWGGFAYGYRPWLDVTPLLALFIVPVLETATATRLRRAVFGVALSFSVFVQALGALSYDGTWNARELFLVRLPDRTEPLVLFSEDEARAVAREQGDSIVGSKGCNIDFPDCRYRLWSIRDSLIVYQLTHFKEARARRLPSGWAELLSKASSRIAENAAYPRF